MSSKNKDKGYFDDLKDFFKSSKNFITSCQKPNKKGILSLISFPPYRIHHHC